MPWGRLGEARLERRRAKWSGRWDRETIDLYERSLELSGTGAIVCMSFGALMIVSALAHLPAAYIAAGGLGLVGVPLILIGMRQSLRVREQIVVRYELPRHLRRSMPNQVLLSVPRFDDWLASHRAVEDV